MRKTEQVTSVNVMGWVAKIIAWVRTLQRHMRDRNKDAPRIWERLNDDDVKLDNHAGAIVNLQLQIQDLEGKIAKQLQDGDGHLVHPVALPVHKRLTEMEEKIARFHQGFANQAVKIDKLESAAWKATGREEPEWRAIFDLNTKIQIRLEQAERHIAAHSEKIKDCASDFQIASLEHKTEEHDKKLAEHLQSIHAITDGMMRLLEVEERCKKLETGSVSDPKGAKRFADEIRSEVARLAVAYEKGAEDRQANFNRLLETATTECAAQVQHLRRDMTCVLDGLEKRMADIGHGVLKSKDYELSERIDNISRVFAKRILTVEAAATIDREELRRITAIMRGAAAVTIESKSPSIHKPTGRLEIRGAISGTLQDWNDRERFINEVFAEIDKACTKFPSPQGSLAALGEEVGELCKAMRDEDTDRVRKEAVQVACMAFRVGVQGDPTLAACRARANGPGPHPVVSL